MKIGRRILVLLLTLLLAAQCTGCFSAIVYGVIEAMYEGDEADAPAPEKTPVVTPRPELYPLSRPEPFATLEESRYMINLLSKKDKENAMALYEGIMSFEASISMPHSVEIDRFLGLLNVLRFDCPELHQWAGKGQYSHKNGKVYKYKPEYRRLREEYEAEREELDAAVSEILSNTEGMSLYNAILYCYDTLTERSTYLSRSELGTATAYEALVDGRAQCMGYELAMLALLRGLGVPCFSIIGEVPSSTEEGENSSHSWVALELNGAWYAMDPTWDDTDDERQHMHAYFCVSDEAIAATHKRGAGFDYLHGVVETPPCTGGPQNYYVKMDTLIRAEQDSTAALNDIMYYALAAGQSRTEIRVENPAQYERVKQLLKSAEVFEDVKARMGDFDYVFYRWDNKQIIMMTDIKLKNGGVS